MSTNNKKNSSMILAIRNSDLPEAVQNGGLNLYSASSIEHILKDKIWMGPRWMLEEDSSFGSNTFRQIIPCVVIRDYNGKILVYKRTTKSGETRLHNKVSLTVGGHCEFRDAVYGYDDWSSLDVLETMEGCLSREVEEELGDSRFVLNNMDWVGLITSNEEPVSRVHVGVVQIWDLEDVEENVLPTKHEDALTELEFVEPEQLLSVWGKYQLEGWARILATAFRDKVA